MARRSSPWRGRSPPRWTTQGRRRRRDAQPADSDAAWSSSWSMARRRRPATSSRPYVSWVPKRSQPASSSARTVATVLARRRREHGQDLEERRVVEARRRDRARSTSSAGRPPSRPARGAAARPRASTAMRWRTVSFGPHSPSGNGRHSATRAFAAAASRPGNAAKASIERAFVGLVGHATGLLVDQVRREPARRLIERDALSGRVVGQLVATDPADPEVVAVGVPQVVAGDRGARPHRERFGQPDAGPRLRLEQVEQRALLRVVGAGRVARRGPDALVALGDEVGVRERLVGRVAPQLAPDALVEPLGEGLGQAVGEGLGEDRRVVVVGRLELGDDLVEADAGRDREGADVVGDAGLGRGDEIGEGDVGPAVGLGHLLAERPEGRPRAPAARRRTRP